MPFLARDSTPGAADDSQPHGEIMKGEVRELATYMALGAENDKVAIARIERLHDYATNVDADAMDGGMTPYYRNRVVVLMLHSRICLPAAIAAVLGSDNTNSEYPAVPTTLAAPHPPTKLRCVQERFRVPLRISARSEH